MGLTDLEKTIPFLARKPSFHTNIKVTLHFRNSIGLKDSLDTALNTEFIIKIRNSTSFMLKNQQIFCKKNKKGTFEPHRDVYSI